MTRTRSAIGRGRCFVRSCVRAASRRWRSVQVLSCASDSSTRSIRRSAVGFGILESGSREESRIEHHPGQQCQGACAHDHARLASLEGRNRTPVAAAARGTGEIAGAQTRYGKIIETDHGNGLVTRYAHASQLNVRDGDRVLRGQRVAAAGSTGRSTGPHLHFEVRLNGVPQNPARFLRTTG
ncbi:MAG: M23 family metallopeptidase [Betaproteobacteria bacterium]|nr:M23 family metallopeptidase [Betaproteobacteria bacterium]